MTKDFFFSLIMVKEDEGEGLKRSSELEGPLEIRVEKKRGPTK